MPSSALWLCPRHVHLDSGYRARRRPSGPRTGRGRPRPPCRRIRTSAFVRFSQLQMKIFSPFRLRAGDVIRFHGQPCRVLRVSDCSAVVAVTKQPREFTTLFALRSFAISPYEGSAHSLVTNDPLEVSPLSRRSRTPIRSITERPWLFPASSARHSLSVPCGRACLQWEAKCRVYDV
jgi:hypothetical protein